MYRYTIAPRAQEVACFIGIKTSRYRPSSGALATIASTLARPFISVFTGFSHVQPKKCYFGPIKTEKVSSPDMQRFVGAMVKFKAKKGYFITTSAFSRLAANFAEGMNIELIDGQSLIKMIAEVKDFPSPAEFIFTDPK